MAQINNIYTNLKSLKEQTFGDTAILIMIIEQFLEDIDVYQDVLNNEIANQNWETLFQATHKIKPSISLFGIDDLAPIILQLEKKFRDEKDLEEVGMMSDSVKTILKQVKLELQTKLKSLDDE